jgi:hypothetical protein
LSLQNEANAHEIATCKQNVRQEEDFMHSNFQMDISLPWIDAVFTYHLKVYLNIFIFLFFAKYLLNQSQWTLATIIEDYAVKKEEKK